MYTRSMLSLNRGELKNLLDIFGQDLGIPSFESVDVNDDDMVRISDLIYLNLFIVYFSVIA